MTEALRATLLDRYQREGVSPPPILHGHGMAGSGYDTARYLALPDVGHQNATGRIHGLAVWLPPLADQQVVEACRDALHGLSILVGKGFSCDVRMWAGEARPHASNPDRWTRPSAKWTSAFPVVHERRLKTLGLGDVASWCEHAGVTAPAAFRSTRSPLIPGAVDLAPSEATRADRPARPYTHIELVFDREVPGPIVIGAARQFGLGLMAPQPSGGGTRR